MELFIVYSLILTIFIQTITSAKEDPQNNSMASSGWRLEDYPNPMSDPVRCGYHGKTSFLCDPDGVLSHEQAKAVLKGMEKLCHNTENTCPAGSSGVCIGYAVVVALVDSFDKVDSSSSEAKRWANGLREKQWLPNGCGNDFLFVASNQDKEIALSLGQMAQEHLTNKSCLRQKLLSLKYRFHDHSIGEVLQSELKYLRKSITGEMKCPKKKVDRHLGMPRGTIGMIVFAGLFVISLISLLIYALVKKQKPGTQTLNAKGKCAHL